MKRCFPRVTGLVTVLLTMAVALNLNLHSFSSLSPSHARLILVEWRRHYNEERPHSSLGNQTPRDFVVGLSFAPKMMDAAERPTGQGNPAGELTLGLDPPPVLQSAPKI